MHPVASEDATKCSQPMRDAEACIHTTQPIEDDGAMHLNMGPTAPPPTIRSTWTVAGSTTDTNGSSTTTRGRRRFRRRLRKIQQKIEPPAIQTRMRVLEIESAMMEVTISHTAWEACSCKCLTEACDADISSLSDYDDLPDEASSGDDSSVSSSTPSTRIAIWRALRRTPLQSNVSRPSLQSNLSRTPLQSNLSWKLQILSQLVEQHRTCVP